MNSFKRHHKSGNQIKVYIVSTLKQKSVDLIEIIKNQLKTFINEAHSNFLRLFPNLWRSFTLTITNKPLQVKVEITKQHCHHNKCLNFCLIINIMII